MAPFLVNDTWILTPSYPAYIHERFDEPVLKRSQKVRQKRTSNFFVGFAFSTNV